ncbi:hypothetical protein ACWGE0_27730 [Lentzea sp. NPDC054927]
MDQLLAGYLVAARTTRTDWQAEGLPSGDLISMSGCVADLVPARRDGWDDWFDDPVSAEQARTRAGRSGLQVLAVGIAATDAPALLQDLAEGGLRPDMGGVAERLDRQEAFPGPHSGRVRGFELVGYDSGLWHTWTCLGGLVNDVRQATGIRPGAWGLIQDEQEARRAAAWLTASGLGDPKVFLWVPALLVEIGEHGDSVTAV